MDSSFVIRPKPGTTPTGRALRDPVTVREAVDTELGPAKTVTATSDGGAKPDNSRRDDGSPREDLIDPESRDALFSAVDVRAEHGEQTPNQALMRQRAYSQHRPSTPTGPDDGSSQHSSSSAPDPHADIEA
jgi:hypothetical protein